MPPADLTMSEFDLKNVCLPQSFFNPYNETDEASPQGAQKSVNEEYETLNRSYLYDYGIKITLRYTIERVYQHQILIRFPYKLCWLV